MNRTVVIGLLVTACRLASAADTADNWPQWRGPQSTGVATAGNYPVEFDAEKGVQWKVALPGIGSSTPAVWGEQIFVTCGIDDRDGIICYGMDGNEQWRQQFGEQIAGKHRNGSGSNPSPITNGKHVVVYYKSGTLACLGLAGKVVWNINLDELFGKTEMWWDLGTSPVFVGDRVIIARMHASDSFLAAFNVADGSVAWKQPRQYECAAESDQSYATPQIVQVDGKDQIVTWGADHLTGHDADTGKPIWESGGFNPRNEKMWRTIASAGISENIAVVPFGRGKLLAGVRLGGTGDVTQSNRLWLKQNIGSDVPTPVIANGRAYLLTDKGRIVCLDVQTGDEFWSANLPKNRSSFFSSPVLAGDKFYCAREDGVVFVGEVSDGGFKLLAENEMGEPIIAAPIPIRGDLLLRGTEHLFRISGEAKN